MSPADFIAWQTRLCLSIDQAAALLDVARRTITSYRASGAPRVVALACAYLEEHQEHCQHLAA